MCIHFIGDPLIFHTILDMIVSYHNDCSGVENLQSHLSIRLCFWILNFFTLIPPSFLHFVTMSHLTRWIFFVGLFPCHKKFLPTSSSLLATLSGIGKRDIIYVGKASRTLLTKVSLPHRDKYCPSKLTSFFSHFSDTEFHADLNLFSAPNGILKVSNRLLITPQFYPPVCKLLHRSGGFTLGARVAAAVSLVIKNKNLPPYVGQTAHFKLWSSW